MSAGLGKRGRAEAVAPPFLSPVSSYFRVRAFSIGDSTISEPSRSLEQARGVTK